MREYGDRNHCWRPSKVAPMKHPCVRMGLVLSSGTDESHPPLNAVAEWHWAELEPFVSDLRVLSEALSSRNPPQDRPLRSLPWNPSGRSHPLEGVSVKDLAVASARALSSALGSGRILKCGDIGQFLSSRHVDTLRSVAQDIFDTGCGMEQSRTADTHRKALSVANRMAAVRHLLEQVSTAMGPRGPEEYRILQGWADHAAAEAKNVHAVMASLIADPNGRWCGSLADLPTVLSKPTGCCGTHDWIRSCALPSGSRLVSRTTYPKTAVVLSTGAVFPGSGDSPLMGLVQSVVGSAVSGVMRAVANRDPAAAEAELQPLAADALHKHLSRTSDLLADRLESARMYPSPLCVCPV